MRGLGLGFDLGLGLQRSPTNSVSGPYPPPAGYHWEYVYSNSILVTSNGEPVVSLMAN